MLSDALDRIGAAIDRIEAKGTREVVTVGCVTTFATDWLLQRIDRFKRAHPYLDLRLLTNNNRVNIAGDGLDLALRFGDGSWHGTEAIHLLLGAAVAGVLPRGGRSAAQAVRSGAETSAALLPCRGMAAVVCGGRGTVPKIQGPIFDSSVGMAEAAAARRRRQAGADRDVRERAGLRPAQAAIRRRGSGGVGTG